MVEASYSGKVPVAAEVEQLTHLARYMVRKRELSALIHFVRSDKLPQFVQALSKLTDFNEKYTGKLIDSSYESIRWDKKVRAHFAEKLKTRLLWRINYILEKDKQPVTHIDELQLDFENGKLQILVDTFDPEELEVLNTYSPVRHETGKVLKEVARYEGEFEFGSDMPF